MIPGAKGTSGILIGVSLSTSAAQGADPVGDARRAEELGFDFVTVSDHLHGQHATFETWTLLSWVAAHTSHILLQSNVLGLPYRSPPVVAKMAETLDRLSGGRLILGLGAGGMDAEFAAYGLQVRKPADKLEALWEATEIMRGLWAKGTLSYDGRHFHTREARIEPRAARRIPIWLGVRGPRALTLAGQVADGWSVSMPLAPLEQAVEMRERVMQAASDAGRKPEGIVCQYNIAVCVDEKATPDDRTVGGSPEQVAEMLASFLAAGFTSLAIVAVGSDREQWECLSTEVLPLVREMRR